MKSLSITLIAAAAMLLATGANAQVYRCISPDGKTSYSSSPCPERHVGGSVKLTDNTLETRALRERETFSREEQERQQADQQWMQSQRLVTQPMSQLPSRLNVSSACKLAISNAETQSTLRPPPPEEIDTQRARAAKVCGFNPWPGPTLVQQADERRRKSLQQARMQQEAEQRRGPAILTNCDGAGCWDTNGRRYESAAGGLVRSDGKFCPNTGSNVLNCH